MSEFIVSTDLYETSDANVYTSYHFARALGIRPKLYFVDSFSPMIEKTFHPASIHTNYIKDNIWDYEYEVTVLKKISRQLERLSLSKKDFDFEVFEGSISKGIQHLKQHDDLEFISVGASDHGEIHRLFFNTFAEKTYFNLEKKCLVIKKKDNQFRKVYMLLNPLEDNDETLAHTIELIKKLKTKLNIVCNANVEFLGLNLEAFPLEPPPWEMQNKATEMLYEKTELMLKELESNLKKEGIEVAHTMQVSLNKESALGLTKLLHEIRPDLVIMSPRSHFLRHFSIGSVTHYIIKHNDCNFYLMP